MYDFSDMTQFGPLVQPPEIFGEENTASANQVPAEPEGAWFGRAMRATLGEAMKIAEARGGEYQDSWSEEHMQTAYIDAMERYVAAAPRKPTEHQRKRLIMLASLCDVKASRLAGPYKADTFLDGVNYIAAFWYALEELYGVA